MQPLGSLHLLASEDDVPALTFLLDNGADVDQRDEEGCTALHWAADRGSMQVALLTLSIEHKLLQPVVRAHLVSRGSASCAATHATPDTATAPCCPEGD